MTTAAAALLVLFLVAAAADWFAVAALERGRPRAPARIRWLTKPVPLVLLIAAAVVLDPHDPTVRAWFVVALALSLVGDVALLSGRGFVPGLAAFLLAHLTYAAGFIAGGVALPALAVGAALMLAFAVPVGRRLVGALRSGGRTGLVGPVVAYVTAISAMVVAAVGSLIPVAVVGAALFAASDTLLAERRFVRPMLSGVPVMVLYHMGQGLLVLSLIAPAG